MPAELDYPDHVARLRAREPPLRNEPVLARWSPTMPAYKQMGSIPRKRHTEHRASPGYRGEGLHYEEVVTTAGFGRAYSIVYHLRPPTRVRKVEPAGELPVELAEPPELRHHHLKTGGIPTAGDPVRGRVPLLTNADVTLWRCRPADAQAELYRNARAEE